MWPLMSFMIINFVILHDKMLRTIRIYLALMEHEASTVSKSSALTLIHNQLNQVYILTPHFFTI
jgi:hypothetical protein